MEFCAEACVEFIRALSPLAFFILFVWWLFFKGRKSQRQKIAKIIIKKNGGILAENVVRAHVAVFRMVGLLNTPSLRPGDALIISPARLIHMQGMGFPLDVVFLNGHLQVVKCFKSLSPSLNRRGYFSGFRSKSAVELPAGTIQNLGLEVGDSLQFIFAKPN